MSPSQTVWDQLVTWVPANLHPAFWQGVAKSKKLHPDDDLACLLVIMGIQTFIVRQTPELLTAERMALEKALMQMRQDFQSRQLACANQLEASASSWSSATENFHLYLKNFESIAKRMETVSIEASEKIVPLERLTLKFEKVLESFEEGIRRASLASNSHQLILTRWTYINAGVSALLVLLFILALIF